MNAPSEVLENLFIAAMFAMKPMSYIIRLGLGVAAFGAAMNAEKVVARVIGLVWLLITGVGLILIGVREETIIDIVLGLGVLGAAGYSWWFTRV